MVAVLYWAQPVIVPVVLAVLLTFVIAPAVFTLQRFLGRVGRCSCVVIVTFTVLGFAGWAVTQQMTSIVQELPGYRENIRQKIKDIREVGTGRLRRDHPGHGGRTSSRSSPSGATAGRPRHR